jgi:hypothetical protein
VVGEHQGDVTHSFWRLVKAGKWHHGSGPRTTAMADDKKKTVEGASIGF